MTVGVDGNIVSDRQHSIVGVCIEGTIRGEVVANGDVLPPPILILPVTWKDDPADWSLALILIPVRAAFVLERALVSFTSQPTFPRGSFLAPWFDLSTPLATLENRQQSRRL